MGKHPVILVATLAWFLAPPAWTAEAQESEAAQEPEAVHELRRPGESQVITEIPAPAALPVPADAPVPDTPALPDTGDAARTAGGSKTVLGTRNPDLRDGARELLHGDKALGVELTLRGLAAAEGTREIEAALSNLCAGYIMLERYDEALGYCELLLTRNAKSWRGYNNRAVIYIKTGQYEKAHSDLVEGEALNPGARTLRITRAMYLDAVQPVEPEVEIDDRHPGDGQLQDDEDDE